MSIFPLVWCKPHIIHVPTLSPLIPTPGSITLTDCPSWALTHPPTRHTQTKADADTDAFSQQHRVNTLKWGCRNTTCAQTSAPGHSQANPDSLPEGQGNAHPESRSASTHGDSQRPLPPHHSTLHSSLTCARRLLPRRTWIGALTQLLSLTHYSDLGARGSGPSPPGLLRIP